MRQQERSAASCQRILAAADALFYRDGYHATSLDRIVAQAGVTKGSFYYHFPSKEALAVAVLDFHRAAGAAEMDYAGLEAMPSPREALLTLIGRLLARGHRERETIRVCGCFFGNFALELAASSEAIRAKTADVFEALRLRMRALAERAQAAGEIAPALDCDLLASGLLAIAEGAILLDKAEQSHRHTRTAMDTAAQLLR